MTAVIDKMTQLLPHDWSAVAHTPALFNR